MAFSFQRLMENMDAAKAHHGANVDTESMQAIRTGINIRDDFWDDFLQVINNSSALSNLLDVPVSTISGWHAKVKHALEEVQKADAVPDPKKKGELIPTGEPAPDPHATIMNNVEGEE